MKNVDYKVMLTFLEFYEVLMTFVNFKLFHTLGSSYPPKLGTFNFSYFVISHCILKINDFKIVLLCLEANYLKPWTGMMLAPRLKSIHQQKRKAKL